MILIHNVSVGTTWTKVSLPKGMVARYLRARRSDGAVLHFATAPTDPSVLGDIEGMTSANPCVVTKTSHGLASGNAVLITGVTQSGWTGINGVHTVNVLTSSTFSIPVDTSSYPTYVPGTDPGVVGKVGVYSAVELVLHDLQATRLEGELFYVKGDAGTGDLQVVLVG